MLNPPHDTLPASPSAETDLWLPHDVFSEVQRLVRAAIRHDDDIDPSIMQITLAEFKHLSDLLDNAVDDGRAGGRNLRVTNLDVAALEHLSFYAEEFFTDLGGADELGMTPPDITALSEKLRRYRATAFPGDVAPV